MEQTYRLNGFEFNVMTFGRQILMIHPWDQQSTNWKFKENSVRVCVTRIDWKAAPAEKRKPLAVVLSTACGDTKKFLKVPGSVRRMLWLTQDSFSSIFLECGGLEWLARCRRSVIKWKCSSGVGCRSFVNDIFSCDLFIYFLPVTLIKE